MNLAPHLPSEATLPPFARSLSVYTVFGSIGPSYPQFAARFAPSSRWLYDTIHHGNPDPAREAADCGARIQVFDNQPPAIDEDNALLADKALLARLPPSKPEP